jgi:hypothetical protein
MIAAHEAGHLFANFHTERDQGLPTIMDRGGNLPLFSGIGEDQVFGTADDLDVDLGPDTYSPAEVFTGTENTLQAVSFDLPAAGPRPELVVRPAACDFGAVLIGTSVNCVLELSNEGSLNLVIEPPVLLGPDTDQFAIDFPIAGSYLLFPGFTVTMIAIFEPDAPGSYNASIQLTSNDPAGIVDIPLAGQGGLPQAAVAPTTHDFGEIVYGDVGLGVAHDFTVSNAAGSSGDLQVTELVLIGVTPERFAVDAGDAPFTVASGASHQVTVSLRPLGAIGPASGILRIMSNDPTNPWLDVSLLGFARGPDIAVQPDSVLHFGSIPVGDSRVKTLDISNHGLLDLVIDQITLSGDAAAELTLLSGHAPVTVAPDTSHELRVSWSPVVAGERQAALVISSNDPDQGQLEIGLDAYGTLPEITAEPPAYDFGVVAVGQSLRRRLRVINTGSAILRVTETRITGPDADELAITGGGAPFALAAGGARNVWVTFTPGSSGAKQASLELISNDPYQPTLVVPLQGQGQAVPIPVLSRAGAACMIVLLLLAGLARISRR